MERPFSRQPDSMRWSQGRLSSSVYRARCRIYGLGVIRVRVSDLGFRISGLGLRFWCRISALFGFNARPREMHSDCLRMFLKRVLFKFDCND